MGAAIDDALRAVALFRALSPDDRARLAELSIVRSYDKGEALLYSWSATAPVNYELHAEPDGAPAGYAQSYEKKNASSGASGTLTAPFPGIHGWFWENTTNNEVTVTLKSAGYYNLSHEFRNGQPTKNKMFQ